MNLFTFRQSLLIVVYFCGLFLTSIVNVQAAESSLVSDNESNNNSAIHNYSGWVHIWYDNNNGVILNCCGKDIYIDVMAIPKEVCEKNSDNGGVVKLWGDVISSNAVVGIVPLVKVESKDYSHLLFRALTRSTTEASECIEEVQDKVLFEHIVPYSFDDCVNLYYFVE